MTTWKFLHAGGSKKRNTPQAVSAGEETHQHQPCDAVWKQSMYLSGLPGQIYLKTFCALYFHILKKKKKITINWQD